MKYEDELELPIEGLALNLRFVMDLFHGKGQAESVGNKIHFVVEEHDLWDLHEVLTQLELGLASTGIDFVPDKNKVDFDSA